MYAFGNTYLSNQLCIAVSSLGQSCLATIQCVADNSACVGGLCQCLAGYMDSTGPAGWGGVCIQRMYQIHDSTSVYFKI
jgi:hypothetical protein